MKKIITLKNTIFPMSNLKRKDASYKVNDFVYLKNDELAIVTNLGLYFYLYKSMIVNYHFNFGELYSIELLDERLIIFSGKIGRDYKLITFDYQTKEVVDTLIIAHEVIKIKKINDELLVYVGYSTNITFYHFKDRCIVHSQTTTNHEGNIDREWIKTIEIVDDEVVVYGGSDCKLSFFNHKTMNLLYEENTPGWIRDIEVFEDKLVATDGGSDKFMVYDYINKKIIYYKRIKGHHLEYIFYLGDGDIIFGLNCSDPSILNYKTAILNQNCTSKQIAVIQKRVDAITLATKNRFCYKKCWLSKQFKAVESSENDIFSFVFNRHMIILDNDKKKITGNIALPFYI